MTSKENRPQTLPTEMPAAESQPVGYALSQRAAEQCREIVEATASVIEGKRYVSVEGWQAIAIAHGCVASARDVEEVYDPSNNFRGYKAVGEVRRMADGVVIATGEGYVGVDEAIWFGGKRGYKTFNPRPAYATRAMAQTRSISRACRSAFAHVVVIINKDLKTTPAEEMESLTIESTAPSPPPMPSMREEARQISEAQGYPPGAKAKGAHRKVGHMSEADLEAKRKAQVEAAFDWIDEQTAFIRTLPPGAVDEWMREEEPAARIAALRQAGDGQPGFEHLKPAWEKWNQELDLIRSPVK